MIAYVNDRNFTTTWEDFSIDFHEHTESRTVYSSYLFKVKHKFWRWGMFGECRLHSLQNLPLSPQHANLGDEAQEQDIQLPLFPTPLLKVINVNMSTPKGKKKQDSTLASDLEMSASDSEEESLDDQKQKSRDSSLVSTQFLLRRNQQK